MHIGFVSFESPYSGSGGGVATYLRAMIPSLLEAGHRVTLIAPGEPCVPVPCELRLAPVRLPQAHWYASKLPFANELATLPLREAEWSFAFKRAAAAAMRDDPMDLIETTELGSCFLGRAAWPLIVRLHGVEYTFSRHTGARLTAASVLSRRLQHRALNDAAQITAPSRFQASEVAREMSWPADRVSVVPNAIATSMLDHSIHRGREPESPVILYTGRLARVKGTTTLLESVGQVLKEFPRAEFILAGPSQMSDTPREWPTGTRWLGYQTEEQLAELYRRTTVFAMPSNYETFCISCLEAMAFEIPVVATRAGALPELIDDQVGLTVEPGDARAFGDAICRLLRDGGARRAMGIAGRERVVANFTPKIVRARMLAVYEQALPPFSGAPHLVRRTVTE